MSHVSSKCAITLYLLHLLLPHNSQNGTCTVSRRQNTIQELLQNCSDCLMRAELIVQPVSASCCSYQKWLWILQGVNAVLLSGLTGSASWSHFSPLSCLWEATGSRTAYFLRRSPSSVSTQCSVKLTEMHPIKKRGTSWFKKTQPTLQTGSAQCKQLLIMLWPLILS